MKFEEPLRVLNARRCKPSDGVYVGRPSKFGNPFEIGKDGSRDQVIAKFEKYLEDNQNLIDEAKRELRGYNLICWCAPKRCHASILLKLANEID